MLKDLWFLMVCIIEGIMPDRSCHHIHLLMSAICNSKSGGRLLCGETDGACYAALGSRSFFADRQPHKAYVRIHIPRSHMFVFFPHHTGLYPFHVKQLPTHPSISLQQAGRPRWWTRSNTGWHLCCLHQNCWRQIHWRCDHSPSGECIPSEVPAQQALLAP